MIRNVKPPRNLKGSCNSLGDLGCEFGTVVRLEGGRHSKPWRISVRIRRATVGTCLLVVRKASIHPENVSTKTRRNLPLFNGWLVSEIYLCGKMSANLVGGEKRLSN